MNRTNYHSHCLYCDGRAAMEDFVRFAVAQGYSAYGISSHAPLPFPTAWTMEWDRMDDYLTEFAGLKQKYAGQIELYIGLEIDYLNEKDNPASPCFQRLPLDYRIGSVHLLQDGEGNIVDSDLPPDKFARMVEQYFGGDLELVVRLYFGRSMRMAELGGFDIVGHADKVHYNAEYCSPGVTREAWYKRQVYDYLSLIVSKGYLVEVNTKAFCTSGVFFPGEQYFGILHDLGARVVVNSDSHYPDLISSGRAEALEKLRYAGFRTVAELHGGTWQDMEIGGQ